MIGKKFKDKKIDDQKQFEDQKQFDNQKQFDIKAVARISKTCKVKQILSK